MNEQPRWLDKPGNVTLLVRVLYVTCALLLAADFFIHRHAHFSVEETIGFYAVVGFAAYCVIVLSAKALRRLLHRDENYYGEADGDQDG